jgi:hypothetical protein
MFKKKDRYEVLFVIIYLIEQGALIVYAFKYPTMITFLVSIFPVVFLTTMAIEKICLKVNYEEEIDKYKNQSKNLEEFKFSKQ